MFEEEEKLVKVRWLKKYTKLKYLKKILETKTLHMGDPSQWPDKNDAACIDHYVGLKPIDGCQVACLTSSPDRYHFWEIYGERETGVCLWFDYSSLVRDIGKDPTLKYRKVIYKSEDRVSQEDRCKLPFLKREQYKDEREFRIIREIKRNVQPTSGVSFEPCSLKEIYLNCWLEETCVAGWKRFIKDVGDFGHVKICQNKVLDHKKWQDAVSKIT